MTAPRLIATLALVLGTPLAANATLTRPFSLSELVHASHTIVRGEVVDQETLWDDTWRDVYTLSWVRVDEVLSGREVAGELIVVKQIGGVIDGVARTVVGVAPLTLGDDVVVFARTDGAFHYLVGMAQGAFHMNGSTLARRAVPSMLAVTPPMRPLAPDDATWLPFRAEVLRLVAGAHP